MNNPLANFDLEASLASLPNALRQPMVLAVAASTLAHGLAFLVLPVVTNSAESKKLPDRVVGVVELTPEQQAKLPPSMMVSQFPATSMPTLPTLAGGKVPLTGLFSGMPDTNITIAPTKNPVNTLMDDIARDNAIANSNIGSTYSYTPPSYTPYNPPPKTTPPETPAEKKAREEADRKAEVLKTQRELEIKAEAQKNIDEAAAKKNTQTGPGVTVTAGQQPTNPAGSTPTPPDGTAPVDPAAAQQAEQQRLIAATTYSATGTTPDEQNAAQSVATQAIQTQLDQQLQQSNIPQAQREGISGVLAMSAVMTPPIALNPIAPKLPLGASLNFGNAAPPKEVVTVVQIYVDSDGNLLPFSIDKDQPQAIALTRSSGFKYLDDQAREAIKALIKQQPPKGDGFRSIKYQVPFTVPPQPAQG